MLVQAYVLLYLRICPSAYDGCKDDYNTHHAQLPIKKGPLQEFEAGEGARWFFVQFGENGGPGKFGGYL